MDPEKGKGAKKRGDEGREKDSVGKREKGDGTGRVPSTGRQMHTRNSERGAEKTK